MDCIHQYVQTVITWCVLVALSWGGLLGLTTFPAQALYQNNPNTVTLIDVVACLSLFQNPGVDLTATQIAASVSNILGQTVTAGSFNPVPNTANCNFIDQGGTGTDLPDVIALLTAFQNPGVLLSEAQLIAGVNGILGTNLPVTVVLGVPDNSGGTTAGEFTIEVEFVDNGMTATQQQRILNAAAKWESLIGGDLGEFVFPAGFPVGACGDNLPPTSLTGRRINDVLIQVKTGLLGVPGGTDGPFNTLAIAGPCGFYRPGSRLIAYGRAGFDPADLDNPLLFDVAVHEFGHVLGIGTLWEAENGLPSLISGGRFTGTNGTQQHQSYGGAGSPQVENDAGHWLENVFGAELMTPLLNSGRTNPLSRITLGALQDMGYSTIRYGSADAYILGERGRLPDDVSLERDFIRGPFFTPAP
ncbi:MAG: hypothetical protein OHK0012_09890 [Synechococcales cyanobacterium]